MNNFHRGNKRAAKLTAEQVQDIRRRAATGRWTQRALSAEFEVTVVQIGRIVRREVWMDLAPPALSASQEADTMKRLLALQRSLSEDVPQSPSEIAAGNLLDELGETDEPAS